MSGRIKAADEKFCHECGETIKAKAVICVHCGCSQSAGVGRDLTATSPNGKSQLVAALLAIFLGGFGIHKFYLGRIGWGIVFLLFCWTFIPAIVGFIEGIVLLAMKPDNFTAKYGYA
jgi:TM2 domain-containing membrane protein YozV